MTNTSNARTHLLEMCMPNFAWLLLISFFLINYINFFFSKFRYLTIVWGIYLVQISQGEFDTPYPKNKKRKA